jgi:hypothetical protein
VVVEDLVARMPLLAAGQVAVVAARRGGTATLFRLLPLPHRSQLLLAQRVPLARLA